MRMAPLALPAAGLAALAAAMAATNPDRVAYERYATQRLSRYLKTDLCPQASAAGGKRWPAWLQRQCDRAVESGQPQIRRAIAQATECQDWVLFSIYRTELSASPIGPAYRVATVGAFQQFVTYRVQRP